MPPAAAMEAETGGRRQHKGHPDVAAAGSDREVTGSGASANVGLVSIRCIVFLFVGLTPSIYKRPVIARLQSHAD